MSDTLRTNTLTILGAFGYLVFLALVLLQAMGYAVTWELISLVLLTSSAMLGIDFGIDVFPISPNRHGLPEDDDSDDPP